MAIIEAYGLTRKFGEIVAVKDLSLEVAEGEVLALLGPNGAGKTTTIRMLSAIIAPTSGYAVVAGRRTDGKVEELHEAIGLLTESPGFYNRLSARRNLEFYAGFYPNIDVKAQVEKYLKLMGLWERREDKVGTFSKGMKQRLALARALLHEPKVLFLDEPTSGLDPEVAREVRDLIRQLGTEGRTILLSTHNLTEAELLCHRIAIMRTQLVALDTAENLRHRLFHRQVAVQLESLPGTVLGILPKLPFVKQFSRDGSKILVELDDPEKNRPELVKRIVEAGGQILSVSEESHSLEDIYLSLVREDKP
ncbi:MAG: ABC transporter ATP-binding protein [Chloroflexi bacterium]|nr:ABC transporter ATP-binding protein [Chloroflexota bacterium]